jgi:Holliday junction resolvase
VVDVTAIGQGSKYNIGPATFTVAGHSGGLKATSSEAMSGGTDLVVKVVQQTDIDNAAQKIAANDNDAIEFELQEALRKDGLYAMRDTFKAGDKPEVTTDVAVGAEAEQVIVTQKTTYTMLGVDQDDLKKLITEQIKNKIDKKTQVVLDYGIDDAEFEALDQQPTATRVSMRVTTVVGSDLDLNELKQKVAGKKASAAQEALKAYPGVTEVEVKYSPFWVSSIPKKTSKITLTVEKPQVKNDKN